MGQTYSNTSKRALFALYKYTQTRKSEEFGEIFLFSSSVLKKQLFVTVIDSQFVSQQSDILKLKRQFLLKDHQQIQNLYDIFLIPKGEFGTLVKNSKYKGSDKLACLIFEGYQESITQQIDRLIKQGKTFTEDELWNIADSIIPAMANLQRNGIPVSKINGDNILIMTNFSINLSPVNSYLTEYIRSDKRRNPYKDDLYQFGHLLLYCSTLKQPVTIFSDIESIRGRFSAAWIDHLNNILTQSETERPDALILYKQYISLQQPQIIETNPPKFQQISPQKRPVRRTHLRGLQTSYGQQVRELSPFQTTVLRTRAKSPRKRAKTPMRLKQMVPVMQRLTNFRISQPLVYQPATYRSRTPNNPRMFQTTGPYGGRRYGQKKQQQQQGQQLSFAHLVHSQVLPKYSTIQTVFQKSQKKKQQKRPFIALDPKRKKIVKKSYPHSKSRPKRKQKRRISPKKKLQSVVNKNSSKKIASKTAKSQTQKAKLPIYLTQSIPLQQPVYPFVGIIPPQKVVYKMQAPPPPVNYMTVMSQLKKKSPVQKKKREFSPLKNHYIQKLKSKSKTSGTKSSMKQDQTTSRQKIILKKIEESPLFRGNHLARKKETTLNTMNKDDQNFMIPMMSQDKVFQKPSISVQAQPPSVKIRSPIAQEYARHPTSNRDQQFEYKNISDCLNLLPIKYTDQSTKKDYNLQTVQNNYDPSMDGEEDVSHYYSVNKQNKKEEGITKLITSQKKTDLDFNEEEDELRPEGITEYERVMDKYSKYISNKD